MAVAHISPYDGSWYPHQAGKLNALLDSAFAASCRRTGRYLTPRPLALVVPHAAPSYSGTVAAAAYRYLERWQPERVWILGFSHRGGERGIAIPNVERYRTPLGDSVVDRHATKHLSAAGPFRLVDEFDVCDHSVEIQLPFLQRVAPKATIVPLFVGHLEEAERTRAAEALTRTRRPGDVLLASSDLTHYGRDFRYLPFPVNSETAGRLRALDSAVIHAASSLDSGLFLEELRQSGATACGYRPIALLLRILSLAGGENIFQQELDYQTSGEILGDFSESVSYGALGYFHRNSFRLTESEQHELLLSAEATLARVRATGQRNIVLPRQLPGLERCAPVFVSLHHEGRLLGCIGRVLHGQRLAEAVPQMTVAAALDDPRRPSDEVIPKGVEIEISVLTPMKYIGSTGAFQLGRDGACVECGAHRALLLPQVACPDWTAGKFFDMLFQKAGLGPAAGTSSDRKLYIFQAQVFHAAPPIRSAV